MTFIDEFIKNHRLSDDFRGVAEKHFIPLAKMIMQQPSGCSQPLFVGINGCQGSGKSTLAAFIAHYLTLHYNVKVVTLSLDDFYLNQQSRKQLAQTIHPLLETRGVPGTHNTEQLAQVLHSLKCNHGKISLPRFSKITDNPSKAEFAELPVEIVLMEGWCWGVEGQSASQLIKPCNSMEMNDDKERVWREYVNQQLTINYQPLYETMNYWLFLQAPSFDCVKQWRWQQEQSLIEKNSGVITDDMMSAEQVQQFSLLFQRLTEHALVTMENKADVVVCLDKLRKVTEIKY